MPLAGSGFRMAVMRLLIEQAASFCPTARDVSRMGRGLPLPLTWMGNAKVAAFPTEQEAGEALGTIAWAKRRGCRDL
jgi:hypothetical protein